MKFLERLLSPHLTLDEFLKDYYEKRPFASPQQAQDFCDLLTWPSLQKIILNSADDSWPVNQGKISQTFTNSQGRLNPDLARAAFASGHTLLIRHSEKAHAGIHEVARQFQDFFNRPIDVQIYATPSGEEGFDWHYDVEEVFVIQTHGAKEFRLLKNTVTEQPLPMFDPQNCRFSEEHKKPEIRCLLKAGDWLYIPAGYWHKARAIQDSFHISIGVMPKR